MSIHLQNDTLEHLFSRKNSLAHSCGFLISSSMKVLVHIFELLNSRIRVLFLRRHIFWDINFWNTTWKDFILYSKGRWFYFQWPINKRRQINLPKRFFFSLRKKKKVSLEKESIMRPRTVGPWEYQKWRLLIVIIVSPWSPWIYLGENIYIHSATWAGGKSSGREDIHPTVVWIYLGRCVKHEHDDSLNKSKGPEDGQSWCTARHIANFEWTHFDDEFRKWTPSHGFLFSDG